MPRPNSGTGSAGIKRPNGTIDKDILMVLNVNFLKRQLFLILL